MPSDYLHNSLLSHQHGTHQLITHCVAGEHTHAVVCVPQLPTPEPTTRTTWLHMDYRYAAQKTQRIIHARVRSLCRSLRCLQWR